MIHACSCGFRGKDPELVEGNCPRCGASFEKKAPEVVGTTTATSIRPRRRR